jgi:serine/threonine protein kinase
VWSDQPEFLYAFLDREYFETIDRYQPGRELIDIVRGIVGESWDVRPGGFWTSCTPGGYEYKIQGWKIHVSGNNSTVVELLKRVVPILAEEAVAFKLCSDLWMMRLSTSKNWPRTGAGKLITIYPSDEEQFKKLIESCYQVTNDLSGPYILTDRPYKDSKVIFYRYGEHTGISKVNAHGVRLHAILSPDGKRVSDDRVPYFRLPTWLTDPFGGGLSASSNKGEVWLKNRYRITSSFRYSSSGGIYGGEDTQTGQQVIIREARPRLSGDDDFENPVKLLEKEARILQKLGHTGLTPQFIDLFQEWEHWFLVQEHLQADSLWGYTMISTLATAEISSAELFERFRDIINKLVSGLQVIHTHNIILRDFTKTNVLVTNDRNVKFIDFELAYETDGDAPPIPGWTEGYASPEQLDNLRPSPEADYYALGALIVDLLNVTASGLPLNREGVLAGLSQTLDDLGLPHVFTEIGRGLTDPDASTRWHLREVLRALKDVSAPPQDRLIDSPTSDRPPPRAAPDANLKADIESALKGITGYILNKIDYKRGDRLWPASGELFSTNPVSIQFGAAGTAYYLWRATGQVSEDVVEWIIKRANPESCPPGLYVGLSGVALFLLEIGRIDQAKEVLASSKDWDRVFEIPGLYDGAAGWGLVNLHFWRATGEKAYLMDALEVGEQLLRTAKEDSQGVYWESGNQIPLGFGFGPSGIIPFLLYLNAVQPDDKYIAIAEKALDFEAAHLVWIAHRPLLYPNTNAAISAPKSPSMRHGSAGTGSAAVRLYVVTGDQRYRELADAISYACSNRNTNKLWQDYGPAGWSELLLDMYWFLGEENYLNTAYYQAEHILPYRIYRPEGVAFAGSEMVRVSCDFGMGSAGIGYFFHRVLHPKSPRLLLLDSLLVSGDHSESNNGQRIPVKA